MTETAPSGAGATTRQETLPPQTMTNLFDQVLTRWRGDGPALGHLSTIGKGEQRKQLSLVKNPKDPNKTETGYTLTMIDENDRIEELRITRDQLGQESASYLIHTDVMPKPIEVKLTADDISKLSHRLITLSRWGRERTFNPYGYLDMEQVPPEQVLKEVGLLDMNLPHEMTASIQESDWYQIDNGRIMVEIRNPELLKKERKGIVYISDADDTIFSATNWHKQEFARLADSQALGARNIHIPSERAKSIYDLSKILIPGKADKEPRYTPRLNIALLTQYAQDMERGIPEDQAYENVQRTLERLKLQPNREAVINGLPLDPDVLQAYTGNPISDFLYKDYVEDFFGGTEPEDLRIVATRGTVEGPLGQIYKMHQAGVLNLHGSTYSEDGSDAHGALELKPADIVIYTNDLKAETLTLVPQLFPYLSERTLRIYDDNPSELTQYYDWAKEHDLKNLEMIQVRHHDAKRRDARVEVAVPVWRSGVKDNEIKPIKEPLPATTETIYDIFFPYPDPEDHMHRWESRG